MRSRQYIAIDLKSFYASVECIERSLDPMTTNLVVADASRTEKTICLAVSPSLKAHGISGRARLFEVVQRMREVNYNRRRHAPEGRFEGESYNSNELSAHSELSAGYLIAPPRMALYIDYSTRIYNIYLKYISPEDIHVYSIDEVFMDVTDYLNTYKLTAGELAVRIINDILDTVGITATAGIGSNLYLCKIAMDIVAKHIEPDQRGVRIAELDEMKYRRLLWEHEPITDFWRVGKGYAKKLADNGMYTMGDIARCSIGKAGDFHNEELLYKLFGVNAELLIDHAWGWEPCTMADIKAYRPETNSIASGQVLQHPYDYATTKMVVKEMIDLMALNLVERGLVTDQIVLTVGYDITNLTDPQISRKYKGPVVTDSYGRKIPKHAHGTVGLNGHTSSARLMTDAVIKLYERIMNPELLTRRINISANNVMDEKNIPPSEMEEQLDMFTDMAEKEKEDAKETEALEQEKKIQQAFIDIKNKYGKNALIKGMNLQKDATAREKNKQIGGHKA